MSTSNGHSQPRHTVELAQEMQVAYLDYAMSVIVSRALPDVRDGLKPVQRRILYAMHHDLRVHHTASYRKSARIVGEVLGKYHPHSDQSVYDAMVRLAQDFSLRYPLIDGQGNLGSIDGDNPAAMRYTEARLSALSRLMLQDLDRETVDWVVNFDASLQEPARLPAALPNLLVNGANGIAVGMATQIPPHNLGEICDALDYLLDRYAERDQITVQDLLRFIQGPDFPTGGLLYRHTQRAKGSEPEDSLLHAYARGRGRLTVQAKIHTEDMSMGRQRIVVSQIPYLTNKTHLIERIVHLVRQGTLEGIADIRDESDRAGMRICIECSRTAVLPKVIAQLFAYTPMQQTFSLSMLALVNGTPQRLNLKDLLLHFIDHRHDIVRRCTAYNLLQAQARLHVVEGLLKALDVLDEVISTIRQSRRPDTARANLQRQFQFTDVQAQAILAMPLRQLVALEIRQLREEFRDLVRRIRHLEQLLASDDLIRAQIRSDLSQLRQEFADPRRTRIVEQSVQSLALEDLEPDQTVWVAMGRRGTAKRYAYRGMRGGRFRDIGRHSSLSAMVANTRDMLYLFSAEGKCRRVPIHRIPQSGSPQHVADLTGFTRRDTIVAAISLPRDAHPTHQEYLCLVTTLGRIKRIAVQHLLEAPGEELKVIGLQKGDRLNWVLLSQGTHEVMLFTTQGKAIRFRETEVRPLSLGAQGVLSMKIGTQDSLVAASLTQPTYSVLSVTCNGFAKRTPIDEFTLQGRVGSGLNSHKLNSRTGQVAGVLTADAQQDTAKIAVSAGRSTLVLDWSHIPELSRSAQGRVLADLPPDSSVDAVTLLWSDQELDRT